MNSISFVKSELQKLSLKVPSLQIKYEFDSFDDSHYIEISPLSVNTQYKYKNFLLELDDKFSELYPNELIAFLSEDSISKVENPIYCYEGILNVEKISYTDLQNNLFNFQQNLSEIEKSLHSNLNSRISTIINIPKNKINIGVYTNTPVLENNYSAAA